MKKIALLAVPVLAGCLGSAPKPPVTWTIDVESDAKVAFAAVCAPYGGQRFAVLRSDGSIAFDPRNSFAAAPGSIIKDAVVGRKGEGSLFVRKLALDCRAAGRRNAVVSLEVVVGDRVGKGEAAEPTADGNYSAAFSHAFSKAYANAIEGLKAGK
ncbi:MAG: hypothetical protein IKJ89_01555 [Kiritimatiellae bacterium]|nr:hypothetical protein [Kiritimatiellia bacterium]